MDPGHAAAAVAATAGGSAACQCRRRRLRPGDRLRPVGARPGAGQPGAADARGVDGASRESAAEAAQAAGQAELAEVVAGAEDAYAADTASVAPRRWQSLDEHSSQVRDQAAALLAAMAPPGIPIEAARSAIVAGYLHDVGKAHEIWQDAICDLAKDEEKAEIAAGRPGPSQAARAARSTSPGTSRSATSSRRCC